MTARKRQYFDLTLGLLNGGYWPGEKFTEYEELSSERQIQYVS